jgi:hypothetical protein
VRGHAGGSRAWSLCKGNRAVHAVTLGRSAHVFFHCIVVLVGIGQQVAVPLNYSMCSFALGLLDRGI